MKNLCITVLLAFLMLTLGGCQRTLPAHVRVQVFEVSSLVMDHYIPPEQRIAAPQSAYFVTLDRGALASDLLLQGIHNDAGLLCDDTLDFYGWPPPRPKPELSRAHRCQSRQRNPHGLGRYTQRSLQKRSAN